MPICQYVFAGEKLYHQALQQGHSNAFQSLKHPSTIAVFYGNFCFRVNSPLEYNLGPNNFHADWQCSKKNYKDFPGVL